MRRKKEETKIGVYKRDLVAAQAKEKTDVIGWPFTPSEGSELKKLVCEFLSSPDVKPLWSDAQIPYTLFSLFLRDANRSDLVDKLLSQRTSDLGRFLFAWKMQGNN